MAESEKNVCNLSATQMQRAVAMDTPKLIRLDWKCAIVCNGRGRTETCSGFTSKWFEHIFTCNILLRRRPATTKCKTTNSLFVFFLSYDLQTKTLDTLRSDERASERARASTMMMMMEGSRRENGIERWSFVDVRGAREQAMHNNAAATPETRTAKNGRNERRRSAESRNEGKMQSIKLLQENWLFSFL